MTGAKRILNLGAGNRIIPDAVNHDRVAHRAEIDAIHDLNELPWPWEDNAFDYICARAVLEHINLDLVQSMNECWRLLAPGGTIEVKVPYWEADASYEDPTHRWFFTLKTFDILDPETRRGAEYAFYTERKWRIVRPARLNHAKTSVYITLQVRK